MKKLESIKNIIINELPGYSVYFSESELPEGTPLPVEWTGFGLGAEQSDWLPSPLVTNLTLYTYTQKMVSWAFT